MPTISLLRFMDISLTQSIGQAGEKAGTIFGRSCRLVETSKALGFDESISNCEDTQNALV